MHEVALLVAWLERREAQAEITDSTISGLWNRWLKDSQPLVFQASPAAIRADWQQRLQYLTVKEIRDLAALYQVKLKGIKRTEIQERMLDILCNPAELGAAIQRLQPDTRRLLDLLCTLADFPVFYNPSLYGSYLEAALNNGLKARPIKDCLAELDLHKLFQPITASGRISIPLAVLVLALPNPALFKPLDEAEPARIHPARPFHFTRLALRLLLLAQGGWLTFNPFRNPTTWLKHAEIQISAEPDVIDAETLALLQRGDETREQFELAARLNEAEGLWQPQKAPGVEGGATILTRQTNDWLRLSAQEQSRRLFERVLKLPSSLEMDLASQAGKFQMMRPSGSMMSGPHYLSILSQARLVLARLLERTSAGQWIELESILRSLYGLQPELGVDFTRRLHPAVARSKSREPDMIYPRITSQRAETQDFDSWRKTYGRFHQAILVNTFHWLGLLDVGYAAGDKLEPVAVRLTRFGEFLLGRQSDFPAAPPEPAEKALAFARDGALELDLNAAPLELVNLIVQISTPEIGVRGANPQPPDGSAKKGPAGQRGLPPQRGLPRRFRYYLNDRGLCQAFESGWSLDQISARLEAASGSDLPAVLKQRMQSLWERYGRLQLYEDLALVQFGDDFCLPELLAATRLSQILLFTFSPRLIAIRPDAAADFLQELRSKGYTPRLEGPLDA